MFPRNILDAFLETLQCPFSCWHPNEIAVATVSGYSSGCSDVGTTVPTAPTSAALLCWPVVGAWDVTWTSCSDSSSAEEDGGCCGEHHHDVDYCLCRRFGPIETWDITTIKNWPNENSHDEDNFHEFVESMPEEMSSLLSTMSFQVIPLADISKWSHWLPVGWEAKRMAKRMMIVWSFPTRKTKYQKKTVCMHVWQYTWWLVPLWFVFLYI